MATHMNSDTKKDCVIALNVSESSSFLKQYHYDVERHLTRLSHNCKEIFVIASFDRTELFDYNEFKSENFFGKSRQGIRFEDAYFKLLEISKLHSKSWKYEFCIVSDGNFSETRMESYLMAAEKMLKNIKTRPKNVCFYFFGNIEAINIGVTKLFSNCEIIFNPKYTHSDKFDSKCDLFLFDDYFKKEPTEERLESMCRRIIKLILAYSSKNSNEYNQTKVKELLNKIQPRYALHMLMTEQRTKDQESVRTTLASGNKEDMCRLYDYLCTAKKDEMHKWIIRAYIIAFNKMHYLKDPSKNIDIDWSAIDDKEYLINEKLKKKLNILNITNTPLSMIKDNTEDELCPTMRVESKYIIISINKPNTYKNPISLKKTQKNIRMMQKNSPPMMLSFINYKKFKKNIESKYVCFSFFKRFFLDNYSRNGTFLSPSETLSYGQILYGNLTKETINAPITQEDRNIIEYNALMITNLFYDGYKIKPDLKALAVLTMLYAIYRLKSPKYNDYVRWCLKRTILRIAHVHQCPLSLSCKKRPLIKVSIEHALKYSLVVSGNTKKEKKNPIRRLYVANTFFLEMMKSLYGLEYENKRMVHLWNLWSYICELKNQKNGCSDDYLYAMVMTKIQRWKKPLNRTIVLVDVRNKEGSISSVLDAVDADDAYTLYKLATKTKRFNNAYVLKDEMFGKEKMPECVENVESAMKPLKNIKICRSTFRPTRDWLEAENKNKQVYSVYIEPLIEYVIVSDRLPGKNQLLEAVAIKDMKKVFPCEVRKIVNYTLKKYKDVFEGRRIREIKEILVASQGISERERLMADCKCEAHENVNREEVQQ